MGTMSYGGSETLFHDYKVVSELNSLLASTDKAFKIENALAILEICIDNHDTIPTSDISMDKIQALGAYIERCNTGVELPTVEPFLDNAISFLLDCNPEPNCTTKRNCQIYFERCIFRRLLFSVIFTILNRMTRVTRKAAETLLFTKYACFVGSSYNKLFTNIDFEEKVSLIELLWRGIRRAGNKKSKEVVNTVLFKDIKKLRADNFESDAIAWMHLSGCLNESLGYHKAKGKLELNLSSSCSISEHEFTEVITSPSIFRIHIISSGNEPCLKLEIPYSHMVTISLESNCIELSFKFINDRFNISGLWSAPLKEEVSHMPCSDAVVLMKLLFVDVINSSLYEHMSSLTATINNGTVTKADSLINYDPIGDEECELITNSDDKENSDIARANFNMIPESLMLSNRRKATASLPYNESVTTDEYKLMGPINKPIELDTTPSSVGYKHATVSVSTEASNSVSSCERPFADSLLPSSLRPLGLHESSAGEPLMMSLAHYREVKAKEINSIFKRIYKEELDQAFAEISKLSALQNNRLKDINGAYRTEAEALVNEMGDNHQDLAENLKRLLKELDKLKSNTITKELLKQDASNRTNQGNVLISSCSDLVERTELAIKDIDTAIQRIRKVYLQKQQECSKALEGFYKPKMGNKRQCKQL